MPPAPQVGDPPNTAQQALSTLGLRTQPPRLAARRHCPRALLTGTKEPGDLAPVKREALNSAIALS